MSRLHDTFIVLLLVLLLMNVITTRADEPIYSPICTGSKDNTSSSFEDNRKLLLSALPSNTSLSGGFYNTSIGIPAVYGLALCRGDLTREECLNCVDNGSKRLIEACQNNSSATIFYEVCHVRYSDVNFFSHMDFAGKYPTRGSIGSNNNSTSDKWNSTKQDIVDSKSYSRVLGKLMTEIVSEASDASGKMFATKEANLDDTSNKLYGLGQCTRDLSKKDCRQCLTQAQGDIAIDEGNEGGFIVDNSCNLRYELYPFYRIQPPPGKKRIIAITVGAFLSALVLVLLALGGTWAYCRYRKTKRELPPLRNAQNDEEISTDDNQELPLMVTDFMTIKVATDDFADSNKLGQGGFGAVYK
ncbi:hypothetical protein MKW94_011864, partial [Papaver nudicaule]|nr:hypothetical protein [Papaver nudicaule]